MYIMKVKKVFKGSDFVKRFISAFLAIVLVLSVGLFAFPATGTVAGEEEFSAVQPDKVLVMTTRFENMLNRNYCFGSDFDKISSIIDGSAVSLIDYVTEGTISADKVIDFAADFYGIDLTVFADDDKKPLKKGEIINVRAAGYDTVSHKIKSFEMAEDGTYTVYSLVTVSGHDGQKVYDAVSSFAESEESSFSYNLISSELLEREEKNLKTFSA